MQLLPEWCGSSPDKCALCQFLLKSEILPSAIIVWIRPQLRANASGSSTFLNVNSEVFRLSTFSTLADAFFRDVLRFLQSNSDGKDLFGNLGRNFI
jgi:hypothetical protein